MDHRIVKPRETLNLAIPILVSLLLLCSPVGCEPKPPENVTHPGHLTYLGFTNREVQCSRCHGEAGTGGMFGPKIRGVIQAKGADYVRHTILDGKGEGDNRMPSFAGQLTAEQIEQLLDFLETLNDTLVKATPGQ